MASWLLQPPFHVSPMTSSNPAAAGGECTKPYSGFSPLYSEPPKPPSVTPSDTLDVTTINEVSALTQRPDPRIYIEKVQQPEEGEGIILRAGGTGPLLQSQTLTIFDTTITVKLYEVLPADFVRGGVQSIRAPGIYIECRGMILRAGGTGPRLLTSEPITIDDKTIIVELYEVLSEDDIRIFPIPFEIFENENLSSDGDGGDDTASTENDTTRTVVAATNPNISGEFVNG